MKTLAKRLNEIAAELDIDFDEDSSWGDELRDAISPWRDETVEHYVFKEVVGYTGEEGGGENVDYILSITNTKTNETEYYNVTGYYASYDGTTLHYDESYQVFPSEEVITVNRTTFKDANGTKRFHVDKDA